MPLSTWVGNTWACRANLRAAMWRSWQTCSRLVCGGRAYRREEGLRASGWQRHLCRRKHFRCQKSRSNGDQWNPRHVSLNITKCDVDIRKDLSDNVVMHCHGPRDRQARDEGVDCVGTTDDVLRWCLHQRIPWQLSLFARWGNGGTSLRIESRALCKTRSEEDSGPGQGGSRFYRPPASRD